MKGPMTLREAYRESAFAPGVWLEERGKSAVITAAVYRMTEGNAGIEPTGEWIVLYRSERSYGRLWRCWLNEPTEEERAAAAWMGKAPGLAVKYGVAEG